MKWSDLPSWTWEGPTVNQGGPMVEQRGVVLHIAEGYYNGTISWCRNPKSGVSAHFVVSRQGRIAQLVDTDTAAWTQKKGNARWLSIENEGFTLGHELHEPGWERLTSAQITANAAILVKAHQTYGVPLQTASSPDGRGLGHHSMGAEHGVDWGHDDCPGLPIIAQKDLIIARAHALLAPVLEEDTVRPYLLIRSADTKNLPHVFALFGTGEVRWLGPAEYAELRDRQHVPVAVSSSADEIMRIALLAPGITSWPPVAV